MPFDDVGDSIFADAEVAGDPTIALSFALERAVSLPPTVGH